MKRFLGVGILFLLVSAAEAYINTEGFLSLTGGKAYFDGNSSSLNMNAELFLSPVITIDEENAIYPVYSGYLKGVEDLKKLAGGDVLVRKRMGHNVSFKYVRSKDFNHLKARFSYSLDFINETKDEKWGKGLFDYRTISLGVEFEQERPESTYLESVDFYDVRYPNYSSLISKYSSVIDTTTYTELSKNAGKDVLNSRNIRLGFKYTHFPKELSVSYSLALTYRDFYDQAVVKSDGGFSSTKRKDLFGEFGISLDKENRKASTGLGVGLNYLLSNQNSYDASNTKYSNGFYDYISAFIMPYLKVNFKNKGNISYFFRYERLNYTKRLAQDINGNYTSSKLYQNYYSSGISINYPIYGSVELGGGVRYQVVESNTRYEATYRYNYTSTDAMIGVNLRF